MRDTPEGKPPEKGEAVTPKERMQKLAEHCDACRDCHVADLCSEGTRLKAEYEAAARERDKGTVLKKYRK